MEPRVAAVLLAAGLSSRMGRPKQLLPLGDKLVVNHCVDSISAAGIGEIVVVIGPRDNETTEALSGRPVTIVVNEGHDSDMAGSARIGLKALGRSTSAVLICLVDHPLVSSNTMKTLIESHRGAHHTIIIPVYQGKRGHPCLFPTAILQELFSVKTLRDIVRRDEGRVRKIAVPDEGVVLDMDTREEYEQALKRVGIE